MCTHRTMERTTEPLKLIHEITNKQNTKKKSQLSDLTAVIIFHDMFMNVWRQLFELNYFPLFVYSMINHILFLKAIDGIAFPGKIVLVTKRKSKKKEPAHMHIKAQLTNNNNNNE